MPTYTQEEFFRLMETVQEQGGTHLDQAHAHVYHEEFSGGPIHDVLQGEVKYCNESALFEAPYETMHGDIAPVTLCAIDDRMGLMPRFSGANARGTE